MKRYQKKYGFIDSNSIRRMDYDVKKDSTLNEDIYYQKGYEYIDSIFESNNVPEKYRKVILEFDRVNLRSGAEELFTKIPFLIRKCEVRENGFFIKGNSEATDVTNWMDFTGDFDLADYDRVLSFIYKLIDEDLLSNYMKSIFEFFRVKSKSKDTGKPYIKVFNPKDKKD